MNLGVLAFIAFVLIACVIVFVSVVRWRKLERERRYKVLSVLSNRSLRLLHIFQTTSDRYLPAQIKEVLLEYALLIGGQLVKEGYNAQAKIDQVEMVSMLDSLKSNGKTAEEGRVASQEELTNVQSALQYLLIMLKKLIESGVIDKETSEYYTRMLRYSTSLAYRDLLVKQATQDLDLGRKGQALEKYRTALVELEKTSLGAYSEKEIMCLKEMIGIVEKELFEKNK